MKKVKEPTPHEKAAEKLKESVRGLHADGSKSELEKTADKITGAFKKASKKAKDTVDGVITEETRARFDLLAAAAAELQDLGNSIFYGEEQTPEWVKHGLEPGDEYEIYSLDEIAAMDETERELRAKQHDINVLRAELQDKVAEMRDLKKTNSKMQQTHAAEMQDLKDQLGEMEAAIAALDKSKAEINRERIELIDAAERDDELFTLILNLAQALRRGAEQMAGLAALLEEKVEVRR